MRATTGALGSFVALALAAVLFTAALAFGAVHLWAGAILQGTVALIALAWYARRRLHARDPAEATPRSFVLAAFALVGYLAFQLVPLPPSLLAGLSPTMAQIYDRTHAVLAEIRVPDLPIRPVRSAADETVPVEVRERIRDLARGVVEEKRGRARPIAVDPFEARFELLRYVAYGLALWLAATSPRPHLLLGAIAGGGALMALLAIVELATWNGRILWFFVPYDAIGPMTQFRRMLGSFVNPDHFSAFVAFSFGPMLSLLAAPVVLARRRRRESSTDPLRIALVLLGLAIMAAAILGSGSRGGIFGALLSAIVVITGRRKVAAPAGGWRIVRGRERKNRTARIRLVLDRTLPVLLALLVLVAGVSYVGPGGREMLDERLARTVYGNDLDVRKRFWSQTLPVIPDFAAVGVGLGGWNEVIQRYQRYPHVWYRQNHAHNDYLEWLVEVGLVGFALTLALAAAWAAWASANAKIPPLVRAGLLGTLAAAAWHEFFDFVLRVPANAVLLAIVLGLLCNRRWDRRPTTDEPPDDGSITVDERAGAAPRLRVPKVAAATVLALIAVSFAASDVREFLDWRRIRAGDPSVTRAPRSADTWEALGVLLSRSGLRHHPPTAETFLAAAELSPTAEEAIHRLARTVPYSEDRLRAFEAALFLDPTRSEWRQQYAAALEQSGRLDRALDQIELAARLDPVLARHLYAVAKERTVEPVVVAAVEQGFRRALEDHGDVPAILGDLAWVLDRDERHGEAAELWLRAAEASGDWRRFGHAAGRALAKSGDLDRAETVLRRVVTEVPDAPHAYRELALEVLQKQGRLDDAREMLERGIRRSSRRTELHLALAAFHREQGNDKEALAALSVAADGARGNANLQYQLAVALIRAEDYHRGRAVLARALRLEPSRPEFHFLLGVAQERLYDLGEARLAFRHAVELAPENPSYRAALERVEATYESP